MNENTQDSAKLFPHLHVIGGLEKRSLDQIEVDLEAERKHIQEQEEAERYWAGRNLAGRNSTRWAA